MKMLRLAAIFLMVLLSPQVWPPAWVLAATTLTTPTFTISASGDVQAGQSEVFTISRVTGAQGYYVLFSTQDDTAIAGTDYVATKTLLYFSKGTKVLTVSVPTMVNSNALGTTLHFRGVIASSTGTGAIATTVGIIEPPAPPPPPPPPPSTLSWNPAPLQDGGYAKVTSSTDVDWAVTGSGRSLVAGEIVAIYFNGWGFDTDNTPSYAVYAFSDGAYGRIKGSNLQGVVPVGTPPPLPGNWWLPGMVTASKTCSDAINSANPGVTQGKIYNARMLIGSHMTLSTGQSGSSASMWIVTLPGLLTGYPSVVTGDCLTGN
jgi:Calx-beta domain